MEHLRCAYILEAIFGRKSLELDHGLSSLIGLL